MERFSGLLLNVWRQVCSHVKLEESLPRIGPMVRERLPAKLIGVLRIDLASQRLDAVTIQEQTKEHPSWPRHRALAEKELESLLTWGRAETVLRASSPSAQREMVELLSCDHKGGPDRRPVGGRDGRSGRIHRHGRPRGRLHRRARGARAGPARAAHGRVATTTSASRKSRSSATPPRRIRSRCFGGWDATRSWTRSSEPSPACATSWSVWTWWHRPTCRC